MWRLTFRMRTFPWFVYGSGSPLFLGDDFRKLSINTLMNFWEAKNLRSHQHIKPRRNPVLNKNYKKTDPWMRSRVSSHTKNPASNLFCLFKAMLLKYSFMALIRRTQIQAATRWCLIGGHPVKVFLQPRSDAEVQATATIRIWIQAPRAKQLFKIIVMPEASVDGKILLRWWRRRSRTTVKVRRLDTGIKLSFDWEKENHIFQLHVKIISWHWAEESPLL